MSELDGLKEELTYLKLWLGIMIVTSISLVGWLLSSPGSAHTLLLAGGIIVLICLCSGCLALHRRIWEKIEEVRRLR